MGARPGACATLVLHDRARHAGADASQGGGGSALSHSQDQARHRPGRADPAHHPRRHRQADPRGRERRLDPRAGHPDAPPPEGVRRRVRGAAAAAGRRGGDRGGAAPGGPPGRGGRELYRGDRHPPPRGRGGRDQHQARQVRFAARSAADDRHRARARAARDGGVYARVLARHHRGRALHAARRRGRPGRRRAHGERPVRGRHDRRRADSAPHRTRAGRAAQVTALARGTPASRPAEGSEPPLTPRASAQGAPQYAAVVLPIPVPRAYTYEIPADLAGRVVPGARVVVPVQRRQVVGLVAAVGVAVPEVAARAIVAAPDAEPALGPALLELGLWMSRYYGTPAGLALRALLPGALWSVRHPAGPAERAERVLVLTAALPSLLERERAFRRAPKRRVAYEALEAIGGSAPVRHLVARLGLSPAALDGLVTQGLAGYSQVPRPRDPFVGLSSPPPSDLTADQRRVVAGILATPVDTPVLIQDVTGSGKTLVYLDVLRSVVASGKGAILLVPEIALTPQTVARVRGVFGDQVAVLHSGLSDGERADAWRALRRGERRVAVGPRSAVFAPVERLGAIVVDEEHEPSYKQGSAPRYHARDVALVRARLEGARVLLGSATPSLETLHLAAQGRVARFELPERIGARPLPPVAVVDLRSAEGVLEARGVPWTTALDE